MEIPLEQLDIKIANGLFAPPAALYVEAVYHEVGRARVCGVHQYLRL